MSDSDSECLSPRNLFNLDNGSSISKAVVKGKNFRSQMNLNISNMSTMPPNPNFDKRFYDDGFSQKSERSRYDRPETSPKSMRSMPGYQPRGIQQSFYPGAMAHSSMMSSRAVSPTMSMRSMNSNVSSCDFILSALHTMQFNKYELRNIEKTCNKLLRGRIQKKHSKREKLKSFLKGVRRRPSYDSGDLGSDSSTSSDDHKSTKTSATMYKGHNRYNGYNSYRYPQSGRTSDDARSIRSTYTDITDVRRAIRDPDLYRDRTESIKQSSFKNMFSLEHRNMNVSSMSRNTAMNMSRNTAMNMSRSTVMGPPQSWMGPPHSRMGPPQSRMGPPQSRMGPPQSMSQRDRFKNSFLLPSQRFNRSNVTSIPEESNSRHQEPMPFLGQGLLSPEAFKGFQPSTDLEESEQEEIFHDITVLEKTIQRTEDEIRGKRNLNCLDEPSKPESKRGKMATPKKARKLETPTKTPKKTPKNAKKLDKTTKPSPPNKSANKKVESDFVFAKPQFPLKTQNKVQKKPTKNNTEPSVQKTLESKENIQPKFYESEKLLLPHPKEPTLQEILAKDKQNLAEEAKDNDIEDRSETTLQSTSDVSMRPSFIKRKLFTQTLDVTEIKNGSNDSLSSSPQSTYDTKEKNKTRKLVTNSHYLSRDIQNDESNLLDLIHKIVPAEQINLTQINNRSSDPTSSKVDKPQCNLKSKSAVNIRNMTDSFTDEDIFVDKKSQREKPLSKCAVVIEKIDDARMSPVVKGNKPELVTPSKEVEKVTLTSVSNSNIVKGITPRKMKQTKKDVRSKAHNFWNCDSESDAAETPQKNPAKALGSAKKRRDSPTVRNVVKEIQAVVPTKGGKAASKPAKSPAIQKILNETLNTLEVKSAPILQVVSEKLNTSKTLRIKAAKELKEKKAISKPIKPVDLEETLYDVIKKRRAKNSSSTFESSKDNSNNLTIVNKAKGSAKQIKAIKEVEKPKGKNAVTKPQSENTKMLAEIIEQKPETAQKQAKKTKLQPDKTETQLEMTKPLAKNTKPQPEKTKPQLEITKPLAENTKPQPENPVTSNVKKTQTKPNKATGKTLNTTILSPIRKTRSSLTKMNPTTDLKPPKVTAKKIVTKNIANTVTKDLNQTMTLRRQSMKLNQSRRSMSMQEKSSKTKPTQKIVKKNLTENKAALENNNNVEKIKPKTVLDTMTESDASLNNTRKRGRPRKDATSNNTAPSKKQINTNKENENPNKSIRTRKNPTICACCDDAPKNTQQSDTNTTQKVTQTTIDRFAVPQTRRIDSPISKSIAKTNTSRRIRKRPGQGDVTQWGVGLTKATIGVIPRHCGTEELKKANFDESKSMTIRSIASASILTRSRRPKFLHVF